MAFVPCTFCPRESSKGPCLYPPPPNSWTKERKDFRVEKGSFILADNGWKLMLSNLRLQIRGMFFSCEGNRSLQPTQEWASFTIAPSLRAVTGRLSHHVGKWIHSFRPGTEITAPSSLGFDSSFCRGAELTDLPTGHLSPLGSSAALCQPRIHPSSPCRMDPKHDRPGLALPSIVWCKKTQLRGVHEGPLR